MKTAGTPEGRHSIRRRTQRPPSRAHAARSHVSRRRRPWVAPLVLAVVALLALLGLQALGLLPSGGPEPAASTTTPAPAGPEGTSTQVSIGDTGTMHVVETLTFATAQTRVDLAVPPRAGAAKGFRPTISSLAVRPLPPGADAGPLGPGDEVGYRLASPSTKVVVEYDASGVVVRNHDQANPERALALVTPLVVAQAQHLPGHVDVQSVKVLNVGCLQGSRLTGCGTRTADGWTVETSGGADAPRTDVLAQLNLAVP